MPIRVRKSLGGLFLRHGRAFLRTLKPAPGQLAELRVLAAYGAVALGVGLTLIGGLHAVPPGIQIAGLAV